MRFPPRLISILSLVQFFFVCAGFLFTQQLLGFYDKYSPETREWLGPIPFVAQCVRGFGPYFLMAPALWWIAVAVRRHESADDIGMVSLSEALAGVLLTIALALLFTLAAVQSFRLAF